MAITKLYPPIGAIFLAVSILLPGLVTAGSNFYLLCLSVIFSGWQIFRQACLCTAKRKVDANVLITVAIIGLISLSMFFEAAIYLCIIGMINFIQSLLVQNGLSFLQKKWQFWPASAIKIADSNRQQILPQDIMPDDLILFTPGQTLAVDGFIKKGHSKINPSLFGQYVFSQQVQEGDLVLAGSQTLESDLAISVVNSPQQSFFANVPTILSASAKEKRLTETMLYSRDWSRRILTFIFFMALPFFFFGSSMLTWLHYSLSLLLIFAPYNAIIEASALLIAKALDKTSQLGIILKNSFYLEEASSVNAIAFEKHTTLANGNLIMSNIYAPYPFTRKEVVFSAVALTQAAIHPLAQSILAQSQDFHIPEAWEIELLENNDSNIHARLNGKQVLVGNHSFLEKNGIKTYKLLRKYSEYLAHGSTVLFVAIDGAPAGLISFIDDIHPQIFSSIGQIRANGIQNIIMITKEQKQAAASASRPLGFTAAVSNIGNAGKAPIIQKLHFDYGSVLVIGDMQKDAALMKNADISIAVNSEKNLHLALQNADITLLGNHFYSLPQLFAIGKQARKTLSAYKKIFLFSKFILLMLAFFQYLYLWQIVLLDGLLGTLLVFNSLCLSKKVT